MLDWDDLRFFLAVARHRSLASAAKQLNVTQSTVGRRLATLEAGIGARLLQRVSDGYTPTLAGQEILASVARMEEAALEVERAVAGHDVRMAGVVRVVGSQLVTSHLLAPSLAAMHAGDRSVLVELLPGLQGEAVSLHEADVAVQLRPFERQDLVVRKLGVMAFGLYGAGDYLRRCGTPLTVEGCAGHQLITLLDDREVSAQAAWLSEHGRRADVVLRSDSYETQHWATTSGGGLAVLPRFRADAEPALQLVATEAKVPDAEIWLGVRRENRDIPRVRAVLDHIVSAVRGRMAALDPVN